jgi:hypothetical protein
MELYAETMGWEMPKNLEDEQYAESMGWKAPGSVSTCAETCAEDESESNNYPGVKTIVA